VIPPEFNHPDPRTEKMHSFPLVEVSGTAREMGFQHGAQAAPLIHKYLLWIEKSTGKERGELGQRALAFQPAIEALSPLFVEEVRGLAEGAGISFAEAMICQARGEAARAPLNEGDAPFAEGGAAFAEGCTAFAFTGSATRGGVPLAGQNQDLPPEFSDIGILLHIKPTDGRPRAITFTFAGQLGYMGTNQHGVSHFANAVGGCPWQLALPHYPLKRVLLEQRSLADCLRILETHRTCSPANMAFCDGGGNIADVEIRSDGIALYEDDHPDRRLHTNHYLTSAFAQYDPDPRPDSVRRLERLRTLVEARWGELDVDAVKQILADHDGDPGGICRHGEGGSHSVCGYIAEPAAGLFHVRRGHGCLGTWTAYEV